MTDGVRYPFAPVDPFLFTPRKTLSGEGVSRVLQTAYWSTRYQGEIIAQWFPPLPVLQNFNAQNFWDLFSTLPRSGVNTFSALGVGPPYSANHDRKIRGEVYYDYSGNIDGDELRHTMTIELASGGSDSSETYTAGDTNIDEIPYGFSTQPLVATFEFDVASAWSGQLLYIQIASSLIGTGTAETYYRPLGFRVYKDLNDG